MKLYACKGRGVGKPVEAIQVASYDDLPAGFDFITAVESLDGLVLADDEISLRTLSSGEATEQMEAERVAAIKARASEHILAALPYWLQNNLQSRAIELDRKDRLEGLTTPEQEELDAIIDVWAWVKIIRAESNAAEQAGTAAADVTFTAWGA